ITRAGGGTVRTTSRWISPNGTRSRRDSYCHAVSRSTSVRAFACDVAGRYGTLWKCTNTTRQPRFIIRHAATGESMPPESSAATVPGGLPVGASGTVAIHVDEGLRRHDLHVDLELGLSEIHA